MDQATAERIAVALEQIAGELAAARINPTFIPTGFSVVTPEEARRRQIAAGVDGAGVGKQFGGAPPS
jgi:hypothetical protein